MVIDFRVEPKRINFFSSLYGKKFSPETIKIARENLVVVKDNWNRNITSVNSIFKIFIKNKLSKKIIVSIFPNDYFLGATETEKQLILYGQPPRSKNFSTGLIAHEITHIFLSNIKTRRREIVDEIISFLIEDRVYFLTENKRLTDIWNFEELDSFHCAAIGEAMKYSERFLSCNNISDFILFLNNNVDGKILKIKKTRGLLKNLKKKSSD